MKYIKMLGLAVVAAAALMALVGVGSASATVLCTGTPAAATDCEPTFKKLTEKEVLDATAEDSLLLKTGGGTTIATCTVGTVKGTINPGETGSTSSTVVGTIEKGGLTFSSCSTTVATLNEGTLEVHHIAGTDNGTVTSSGAEVTIKFLGVSCIFKTSKTDVGTLTGGNPATFDISATIPSETGGFCPASGIWSGHYKVTTPSGTLHVAAG